MTILEAGLRKIHRWMGEAWIELWNDSPSHMARLLQYRTRYWFQCVQQEYNLPSGNKKVDYLRHVDNKQVSKYSS